MNGAVEKVLIMAAGTGGHIFPGLAVGAALAARGAAVIWLGTPAGMEGRLVRDAGYPLFTIAIGGLRGRGLGAWLLGPWRAGRAVFAALAILRRERPACVLSMGGYVAGPGGVAARLAGIPLVIHEQNRIPGLTNRWLARFAAIVCTGFAGTFERPGVRVTGNPVRGALLAADNVRERYRRRQGPPRLLVLGGSRGARYFNETVPPALAAFAAGTVPEVRHQCGENAVAETRAAYQRGGIAADVVPFIDDMAAAYGWADLVLARSGALTVSELAAAGVAAFLVPYPYAVDDHQWANGEILAAAGAARLERQDGLDAAHLAAGLEPLLNDRPLLATMAESARRLARSDAAEQVAAACLEAM